MNVQLPVYFTAGAPLQECDGVRARVDAVTFSAGIDCPSDRPYPFAYSVTIRNESSLALTIRGRKWVITDGLGRCYVIEGDGVVGRFPRLAPGERFQYHSYHVVAADSTVEGALLATDDAGRRVVVRIPAFALNVPDTAAGQDLTNPA